MEDALANSKVNKVGRFHDGVHSRPRKSCGPNKIPKLNTILLFIFVTYISYCLKIN